MWLPEGHGVESVCSTECNSPGCLILVKSLILSSAAAPADFWGIPWTHFTAAHIVGTCDLALVNVILGSFSASISILVSIMNICNVSITAVIKYSIKVHGLLVFEKPSKHNSVYHPPSLPYPPYPANWPHQDLPSHPALSYSLSLTLNLSLSLTLSL